MDKKIGDKKLGRYVYMRVDKKVIKESGFVLEGNRQIGRYEEDIRGRLIVDNRRLANR